MMSFSLSLSLSFSLLFFDLFFLNAIFMCFEMANYSWLSLVFMAIIRWCACNWKMCIVKRLRRFFFLFRAPSPTLMFVNGMVIMHFIFNIHCAIDADSAAANVLRWITTALLAVLQSNRFCVVWQSGKCSSSYSGYEWFSDWNEKTESSAKTTKRCEPTLLT